jgi:RNA recognition motif-containing protein
VSSSTRSTSLQAKYGFVAFSDPEDFLKAWKEMDGKSQPHGHGVMPNVQYRTGKYVGNRPIRLKKADSTAIRPVEIGHKKAKMLENDLKKHRKKPY